MKKRVFLALTLILAATAVYSVDLNIGRFSRGQWLDANFDAVWDFSSEGVKILKLDGSLYYDFNGKSINEFSVMPEDNGLAMTFRCLDTGKTYKFIKPINEPEIKLIIDKKNGTHYETIMEVVE